MIPDKQAEALRERVGQLRGRPTPLARGAALAILGSGAFNLCRFAVVVLLARCATPELVGAFDFASVALAAPLVLFLGLELRAVFVADARDEFPFGAYRALRRITLLAAAVIFCAVLVSGTAPVSTDAVLLFMLTVGLGRILLNGQELYLGCYQRHERLDRLAVSNVLRGAVMLAPFAVLMPLAAGRDERTVLTAATAAAGLCAAGWVAVWLLYDRHWAQRHARLEGAWTWWQAARLAWQALPLGVVILIINLCDSVPRWIIRATPQGESDLGFFAALKVIALGVGLVMMQIAIAGGNRLVVYYHTDRRGFLRVAGKLVLVALALGLAMIGGAWLAGEWFLETVYAPEYARHFPEFQILIAAQAIALLATVFGFLTTQMRRFWVQVPIQLAVLAATTAAAVWLIPSDPVRGGAWTALVRSGVQTGLYLACVLLLIRLGHPAESRSQDQDAAVAGESGA